MPDGTTDKKVKDTDYVTEWKAWYDKPDGSNDGTASGIGDSKATEKYCTAYTFNTTSKDCYMWDKTAAADNGGNENDTTCYARNTLDKLQAVKDAWKLAYAAIKDYDTDWAAYKGAIDGGWSAYETKNKVEVKRLAQVAEWTDM